MHVSELVKSKVRVLVVDDSAVCRDFLTHILSTDPKIEVVGSARDGASALEAVAALRPDVITMDIEMPGMNGYDVTRRIMESIPTPIIVVSAAENVREIGMSFRAIESGALAVVSKPYGGDSPESVKQAQDLILQIKLMAEVKVVRRWARKPEGPILAADTSHAPRNSEALDASNGSDAIFIGASTGGPLPIRTILSLLPADFPAPVFVVQHIAPGFGAGFAEWLSGASKLHVRIAVDGEPVQPKCVYIAPDGAHLGVEKGPRIRLGHGEPENGLRPSVDYLFRSAAQLYGKRAVGILLSGMGKDGALELKALKDVGAVTFAQDKETSVIFGMPGEAVRLEGASFVMPPEGIAAAVIDLMKPANARAGVRS
jgi:two-component system, chemotaxis family, protein-glutamate methylesterase/glutaminase